MRNIRRNIFGLFLASFALSTCSLSFAMDINNNMDIFNTIISNGDIKKFKELFEGKSEDEKKALVNQVGDYKDTPPRERISNRKDTPLIVSCRKNQLEIFELILPYCSEKIINNANRFFETALSSACDNNNLKIVKKLIEKGAIIDAKSMNTAEWSKKTNSEEILNLLKENFPKQIKLLKDQGKLNDKDDNGETLIFKAVQACSPLMVSFFLKEDALIDTETMGEAENLRNNSEEITKLLEEKLDGQLKLLFEEKLDEQIKSLNGKSKSNDQNNKEEPLIVKACAANSFIFLHKLLENSFCKLGQLKTEDYINKPNKNDETPLIWACRNNNIKMVELLMPYCTKETINKVDKYGQTPLSEACRNNNIEMVKLLMPHSTKETINKVDEDGKNPLFWACYNENSEMVKLLLDKGAKDSVNVAIDKHYVNTLYWACYKDNFKIFELLLPYCTKETINKVDENGITPLYWACNWNNLEIIKLLLVNGSNVYDKTMNKAQNKKKSIIKLLELTKEFDNYIKSGAFEFNYHGTDNDLRIFAEDLKKSKRSEVIKKIDSIMIMDLMDNRKSKLFDTKIKTKN